MTPRPPNVARWIGLAALAILVLGVAAAWRQWAPRSGPPAAAPPDTTREEAVGEALAQADEDEENRWVDPVPGADVSTLDGTRRALFLQIANGRRCTCGCGYTLAACRVYDTTCDVSQPRVEALLDSVRHGLIVSAGVAEADGADR